MRPKIKKMVFDELADNFQVVNEQEQASSVGGFQNGCFWKSLAFIDGGGGYGYFCGSANSAAALALAQQHYGCDFDGYGYGGFHIVSIEQKREIANSVLSPGVSGRLLTFDPNLIPGNWPVQTLHTVVVKGFEAGECENGKDSYWSIFCPQTNYTGRISQNVVLNSGQGAGTIHVRGN